MASAQEECGCCTQLGWILSCQLSDTQTRFSPSSSTLYCWEAVFMRRKRCLFQMKKIIMDRFLKWSQSLTVEVGIWWYSPVLFWFAPLRSRISSFSRTRTTMMYTSNPFHSDHFHGRMHLPSSPSFKSPLATLTSLLVRVLLTHSVLWLHTFLALLNPQSPMVVETKSLLDSHWTNSCWPAWFIRSSSQRDGGENHLPPMSLTIAPELCNPSWEAPWFYLHGLCSFILLWQLMARKREFKQNNAHRLVEEFPDPQLDLGGLTGIFTRTIKFCPVFSCNLTELQKRWDICDWRRMEWEGV